MSDNEIIHALECCSMGSYPACRDCPYHDDYVNRGCINKRNADIKDLINIQKAEIEKLKTDKIIAERHEKDARDLFKQTVKQLETTKSEAIKEFVRKIKSHAYYIDFPKEHKVVDEDDIDNLLKEMEGNNG